MSRPTLHPNAAAWLTLLAIAAPAAVGQQGERRDRETRPPAEAAPSADPGQTAEDEPPAEPAEEPFVLPAHISPTEQIDFFRTADYDGSGWVSFDEARKSLILDRDGYQALDRDGDFRVNQEEFELFYQETIERAGGFRPPVPNAEAEVAPPRSAAQLRNTFDKNLDGRLGLAELEALVLEYGLPQEAPILLAKTDLDGSGVLDGQELEVLSNVIGAFQAAPSGLFEENAPKSIEELFGERVPRETTFGLPEPPYVRGPVRPFHRLDADGDDRISESDLSELQFPLTLPVRASSVLAALDTDGDGGLDREEFRAALR